MNRMDNGTRSYLEGKKMLVTGGTGSFGHHIVSTLLESPVERVVVYSRDEKKQHDMRVEFEDHLDVLDFVIGDVRDLSRLVEATRDTNVIYHAAALKQVPSCEEYPLEAVKTNILGAENVRQAALQAGAEAVVSVSTDKAVKPVNAMGMTKAIQERIMLSEVNRRNKTRFLCVRYGNVLGSRGSVVPFFRTRLGEGKFLPITDLDMTRFIITLDEAIDLVLRATTEGRSGQLFVRKTASANIADLAEVMAEKITGREDYPVQVVGVRPGEKIHEVLVSEEEMRRAEESEEVYSINPATFQGKPRLLRDLREYTSENTERMSREEIEDLLRKERWIP